MEPFYYKESLDSETQFDSFSNDVFDTDTDFGN